MLWLFWQVTASLEDELRLIVRIVFAIWVVLLCRVVKYMGHFARYPEDLKYILLIPFFGYFHSCFIKMYAMLTMHIVSTIIEKTSPELRLTHFTRLHGAAELVQMLTMSGD